MGSSGSAEGPFEDGRGPMDMSTDRSLQVDFLDGRISPFTNLAVRCRGAAAVCRHGDCPPCLAGMGNQSAGPTARRRGSSRLARPARGRYRSRSRWSSRRWRTRRRQRWCERPWYRDWSSGSSCHRLRQRSRSRRWHRQPKPLQLRRPTTVERQIVSQAEPAVTETDPFADDRRAGGRRAVGAGTV